MVALRPVDLFTPPAGFAHGRVRALVLGCCARCGGDVNPCALAPEDAREYRISALCPVCFAWITQDSAEDCAND